jgi:hypothetical protein
MVAPGVWAKHWMVVGGGERHPDNSPPWLEEPRGASLYG